MSLRWSISTARIYRRELTQFIRETGSKSHTNYTLYNTLFIRKTETKTAQARLPSSTRRKPTKRHETHHHLRGRRPDSHHSAPKQHTSHNVARLSRLVALATLAKDDCPQTSTSRQIRGRRPGVATRTTSALPGGDPAEPTNPLPLQPKVVTQTRAKSRSCPVGSPLQQRSRPPPRRTTSFRSRRPDVHRP